MNLRETARHGWRAIAEATFQQRLWLVAGLLLLAIMLPFGRRGPDDAGGFLAPLTADSGSRNLQRMAPGVDFYAIYHAGTRVLSGRSPYGGVGDATAPQRVPYFTPFRYPPLTALWLSVPLNVLPPKVAWVMWSLFLAALLCGNFLLCVGRRPELFRLWCVLWFAWFPMIAELHVGQFSLLLGTLLMWSLDAMARGSKAGWIGWLLAINLKVFPVLLAPVLWRAGRHREVVIALAITALSIVAAFAIFGRDLVREIVQRDRAAGLFTPKLRAPYAGAQGVQEGLRIIDWKLVHGLSFAANPNDIAATSILRPAAWGVALIYGLICAGALLRQTPATAPYVIGLVWLSWFVVQEDCWEHHYMMLQCLLGYLLINKSINPSIAIVCWFAAGAPSCWWLWYRMGYQGNPTAEFLGLLYFLQRPIAVITLIGVLGYGAIVRPSSAKT